MKFIFLILFTAFSVVSAAEELESEDLGREIDAQTLALLCADQADNRIRLINPFVEGDEKPSLWSYPEEDGKRFPYMPTDAKRVELGGVIHVLASYHGRVQLVRFKDRKLVKDYESLSSCHSAELLPDGVIVTANSNHGKLRLHSSAKEFVDIDLPYAHGVTWDKQRNCLWALGDALYRFRYEKGKLMLVKKYKMPFSPTGHDLFPMRKESKLLVSNNDALFLFDIVTETFETISTLKEIKSASEHVDGSIWISDPVELKSGASWQSNAVIRVRPKIPAARIKNKAARFYKARWWQSVKFSY